MTNRLHDLDRVAARRLARGTRHPLGQGRLQPAGPVRLLHGAGSTVSPRVCVRDAGRPGAPVGRSPRSRVSPTPLVVGRGVLRVTAAASAGSAPRASSCGRLRCAGEARRSRRRCARRCWPTCAGAPAGRRSSRRSRRSPDRGTGRGSAGLACRRRAPRRDRRAASPSRSAPTVALGQGGFADDTAPAGALVAVRGRDGRLGGRRDARRGAPAERARSRADGRRRRSRGRVELPAGEWVRTLQTTWVEPAYLEPDASWCEPGGEPTSPLANGGAFGGKSTADVGAVARRLADEHGRPVRVLCTREDVVRLGPKRPPIAAGVRADGTGVLHVARTAGHRRRRFAPSPRARRRRVRRRRARPRRSRYVAPGGPRPPCSSPRSGRGPSSPVRSPDGGGGDGVDRRVRSDPRPPAVRPGPRRRRSFAATASAPLTWRSAGSRPRVSRSTSRVTRTTSRSARSACSARSTPRRSKSRSTRPPVRTEPVNGSDAVFAAVAAAAWHRTGWAPRWPTGT